ncbi:hypothetical protein PFISCL1PPCAC_14257, partial [Pristionchus fissidentatus]
STWATCSNGFELVRNGDCQQKKASNEKVYAANGPGDYKMICGQSDAQTVIIKNQEDQDYWASVAKADHPSANDKTRLVLGIECNRTNAHYVWTDGSPVNYKPEGTDDSFIHPCDSNNQNCMWFIEATTGKWAKVCNEDLLTDMYCVVPHAPNTYIPDELCGSFSNNEDNGMCYQVIANPANWAEATSTCRSLGANIVSIHSNQVNSFVRRMAVSKGLVNGLMLGARVTGKGNKYQWDDGSDWNYDNFAGGFPIDGLGDCLAMETNNHQGPWINLDCSIDLPFACVRQTQDSSEPICDGSLHAEGDIILSPGFPTDASIPCDFMLKVDPGMLVQVEILFLEANTCCDHLVLFEGPLGGAVIADLTGEQNHNGTLFTTTSQNIMRASWQPKGGKNVKGMIITFRGVAKH